MGRRRLEQGVLIFDYGEAHIRCGGTADKPWFVAKDVCDVLGLANVSQALERLDDDEKGITTVYPRRRRTGVYNKPVWACGHFQ
jgi:prophage antirepressor-like protein